MWTYIDIYYLYYSAYYFIAGVSHIYMIHSILQDSQVLFLSSSSSFSPFCSHSSLLSPFYSPFLHCFCLPPPSIFLPPPPPPTTLSPFLLLFPFLSNPPPLSDLPPLCVTLNYSVMSPLAFFILIS